MAEILQKYAALLTGYCLELKKGERLYIQSTTAAEDLVREVYREACRIGVHTEISLTIREQNRIFLSQEDDSLLEYISPAYQFAVENFEAFLIIRAPYNLKEDFNTDAAKAGRRQHHLKSVQQTFFRRIADKSMKRCVCQFPTPAAAQEADMSLEEYQHFVYNACHLYAEDPVSEWIEVRSRQQHIVDLLNQADQIRYVSPATDISFSVKGRTWINSDGRANMPSGEVFTGPVENSLNGHIHFDYPSIFMGNEVQGITLWVRDGEVYQWKAEKGEKFLDTIFNIEGARYFGEVAIGTNYNIQKATKNILFDEKIGGTVHMAIGQSYIQTGGKNVSPIHWDMISDMKSDGEIWADGTLIYRNGQFLI
jgi:aminopeptidase